MEGFIQWLDVLVPLLLLLAVALYFYARAGRRARLRARALAEIQRRDTPRQGRQASQVTAGTASFLQRLGSALPLLNQAQRDESSGKLVAAGYRSPQALLILAGLTVLSVVAALLLLLFFGDAYLEGQGTLAWGGAVLVAVYLGTLFPRLVLDRLVSRRQDAIRLTLPDALDLLVITTNAGLALNGALDRVANEMMNVAPQLADELKLTATELQLSGDVERVFDNLAKRTNLEAVRSLANTLTQARQYGTSITQALRILARSERTARMMRLEESAAKLAVKMTLPMMVFILPTVVIVAAGPAILGLVEGLSNM